MILVVGATGVLGREIVASLREAGRPVRAMTRRPARAAGLLAPGVEVVPGDLTDSASLARAVAGATHAIAAAHGMLGRGRYRSEAVDDQGHRALVDAARAAGVGRFVDVSALGAAPDHPVDFFRTKHRIERYLAGAGMPFVILRPAAFMEWHAHAFNGKNVLARGKTMVLGRGTRRRNFVAAADVAALAVRALHDAALTGRTIPLGTPGNYTDDEVAAIYGRAVGIVPRVSHVPPAVLRGMAALLAPVAPGIARIMRLAALPDAAYDATFDSSSEPLLASMRLKTLEEFVRERCSCSAEL